jgi:hypothetical protein
MGGDTTIEAFEYVGWFSILDVAIKVQAIVVFQIKDMAFRNGCSN